MANSASTNARSLLRYRQKRDFEATTEPSGKAARSLVPAAGGALSFVVQKRTRS